ncbi:MAG: transglutaminase-like domain-containing protein [Luteolibacter sp.]|uniref:transglutaminase-like domain-containing protein n=1 Tax=Luteolibacter sp. TaxID=1962973 RepID=UPI00326447F0
MHTFGIWLASAALVVASATEDFISTAKEKHGASGEKAARFLVENMPAADRDALGSGFLTENLDLAFKARETFPWAKAVPEAIFLNDVLPYAVFDEPRDPWRADFFERAAPLVKDAKTATEAVQDLNKEFFKLVNTHYDTGRKRTNQSPKDSMEQGKATCTGLSILLVDVCRAVGIPARAVGTPMWTNGRGNHTWIEIWDGDWHFTGADEYDAGGLDRGWFTGDAAKADASKPANAIYATSWKKDGLSFPMIWAENDSSVAAVNVTARYTGKPAVAKPTLGIRFFDGETRLALKGWLIKENIYSVADFETKAGSADLNDMPRVEVEPGSQYRLRFQIDGKLLESAAFEAGLGETTRDVRKSELVPVPVGE